MPCLMVPKHDHSALIDAIGSAYLTSTFGLTPQRLHMWRVRGVPRLMRLAVARLAAERAVDTPPGFLAPLQGGLDHVNQTRAA